MCDNKNKIYRIMNTLLKKSILLSVVLLLVYTCNDDDTEVFSEAPANRATARNNELLALLTAQPNGFKATYFSKNDEFGGFTFYMRFKNDGTVDMTSDFDADTAIQTSTYDVNFGTTNELVFTTRNHIQKLGDTNRINSTDRDVVFKGTSVFQFFSNENGVLNFRDVRNTTTGFLTLEPSGFTNFEQESVQSVEARLAARDNLVPTAERSVFQVLEIENRNGIARFDLNYNTDLLFATPTRRLRNGSESSFGFGVLFTENGIQVSPAIEFEGESYQNFTLTAAGYVATVNGTTATLGFAGEPAAIGTDVEEAIEFGPQGFLYDPELGRNSLTSLGFDALLEDVALSITNRGFGSVSISTIELFIDYESDDCDSLLFIEVTLEDIGENGIEQGALYCLGRGAVVDRKIFLNYQGPTTDRLAFSINAETYEENLMPIIDLFTSENGLVYTSEGQFFTDSIDFINPSGTFTSLDNPTLRLYGLWFTQ